MDASRGHDQALLGGVALDRADHLRVGRKLVARGGRDEGVGCAEPGVAGGEVGVGEAMPAEGGAEFLQRDPGIGDQRLGAAFCPS